MHAYHMQNKMESYGKYLRVAADIFRESSNDGSAILRSSQPRIC